MKRNEAFELLELFKTKANDITHLYDVYHDKELNELVTGEREVNVHVWFIYKDETDNSPEIAFIRFEDWFYDEEYIVEIRIRGKFYQVIDYKCGFDLINTIKY